MTGQKGNFGQMMESSIKSTLQTGLGALAQHFDLGGLMKRDGQSANTTLLVIFLSFGGKLRGSSAIDGLFGRTPRR
jgi:hypothetical protein